MNATRMMTLLATTSLALATQALTLSVKDVKIAQRYPWNGLVDIDYTVECDDPEANVYVYPTGYDKDYNTTMPLWVQYLSGEGATNAVKAGTHRMTWNMAKQMGSGYNRAAFSIKMNAYAGAAPYMVIDLAAGANAEKYTISYLDAMPGDTWPDEYKTTKLVLKLIPAGSMPTYCGVSRTLTLTQPFYCGVFEMTQQQYHLITGAFSLNGTSTPGKYPMHGLQYTTWRGSTLGIQWPKHMQVDATSVIGKLRARTGITFDLPTEAQWEYACRAGTVTAFNYNSGSYNTSKFNYWTTSTSVGSYNSRYYVYYYNSSYGYVYNNFSVVGSFPPNAWGLYDMHSNVSEFCRDWYGDVPAGALTDPVGVSSGSYHVLRGGSMAAYSYYYKFHYSYARNYDYNSKNQDYGYQNAGCRLVAIPGDGTK